MTPATAIGAAAPPSPIEARAAKAAEEFEAMLLAQLLQPMFDSVKAPSIAGGGGVGEAPFQALLIDNYARSMAARGGLGFSDAIKAALIDQQTIAPTKERP